MTIIRKELIKTPKYSGKLIETETVKKFRAYDKSYGYIFNKKNGYFVRPVENFFYALPELLDMEVTTICDNGCPFCYKNNTKDGHNMSFDTFQTIFDKLPKSITQIAFGADATALANPDLFKMMAYASRNGIIPNITVADITPSTADRLANVCGAVAVSRYANKNKCYDAIKFLTDRGMDQVNIHMMVSNETYKTLLETLDDYENDERLAKMKAIVMLSLKKKGR